MLMFTPVQLCANRKHDFLHVAQWHCPGTSPSQIILTKKGKGGNGCGADSAVLIRGTAKNPFDWSMGCPTRTPVHGPWKPDSQNNVNIKNISLKTMWNGLTDVTGRHVEQPHACCRLSLGGHRLPACGHAREAPASKQAAPTLPLFCLFHMKVCKKQVSK